MEHMKAWWWVNSWSLYDLYGWQTKVAFFCHLSCLWNPEIWLFQTFCLLEGAVLLTINSKNKKLITTHGSFIVPEGWYSVIFSLNLFTLAANAMFTLAANVCVFLAVSICLWNNVFPIITQIKFLKIPSYIGVI